MDCVIWIISWFVLVLTNVINHEIFDENTDFLSRRYLNEFTSSGNYHRCVNLISGCKVEKLGDNICDEGKNYLECNYSFCLSDLGDCDWNKAYVDNNSLELDPDGTVLKPYNSIKWVFSHSNFLENLEIILKPGTHIVDFSLDMTQVYNISIKIRAENDWATLQLRSPDFEFPKDLKSLILENIILDGQKALDPECNDSNCGYCKYVHDYDGNYRSTCEPRDENLLKSLIELNDSGNLYIANCKFINMRQDYRSLIHINNGKIELIDVDFENIKVHDSNSQVFSVIKVDCKLILCVDSFLYYGGSVTLIGNGYEYYSNIVQSGFLIANNPGNLKIINVEFSYNRFLCGLWTWNNCPILLAVIDPSDQVIILNNRFHSTYTKYSYFFISYQGYSISPHKVVDGKLAVFANLVVKNNTFADIASSAYLLEVLIGSYPVNIEISNNSFEDVIADVSLIRINCVFGLLNLASYGELHKFIKAAALLMLIVTQATQGSKTCDLMMYLQEISLNFILHLIWSLWTWHSVGLRIQIHTIHF